ncbi:hypothetical protein H5410_002072 [Solanum commersonii]|uniref:Uncharacterized protein n=1 Tax=Solanum commersonii TaxID=4109 RepID=A0A9J6B1C0_SOLCO|nr:hypothetical protein H5410_002072 [Solanum commersonii]
MPWMISGDFNGVLCAEEKIGQLPVYLQECEDFDFCINSYCIFKRTDRVVINHALRDMFGKSVDFEKVVQDHWEVEVSEDVFVQCNLILKEI